MPPMAKSIVKNLNIKYLVRVCYYVITYALLSDPTYQWVFFLFYLLFFTFFFFFLFCLLLGIGRGGPGGHIAPRNYNVIFFPLKNQKLKEKIKKPARQCSLTSQCHLLVKCHVFGLHGIANTSILVEVPLLT